MGESGVGVREIGRVAETAARGVESIRPVDVARLARGEGWSVDALRAATEASANPETVALRDSQGDVATMVSESEMAVYRDAGLEAANVNGREVLVRPDIDWDQIGPYNLTNLERAEQGLTPLDENGEYYNLHHVQQRNDGQLAELRVGEHQGAGSDVLHDNHGPSEIDRKAFEQDRAEHWQARAAEVRAEREGTAEIGEGGAAAAGAGGAE